MGRPAGRHSLGWVGNGRWAAGGSATHVLLGLVGVGVAHFGGGGPKAKPNARVVIVDVCPFSPPRCERYAGGFVGE